MQDSARLGINPSVLTASAVVVLSLIGLAGGATAAVFVDGDSNKAFRGSAITPSSSQAGLVTPTVTATPGVRSASVAETGTSTAPVSSDALPTSETKRPEDSDRRAAPAAPAPAPVRAVPAPAPRAQAPTPVPYRPAPAPAPAPARAPAPAPAPQPGITIDLGGRGHIVPQAPILPKELHIG